MRLGCWSECRWKGEVYGSNTDMRARRARITKIFGAMPLIAVFRDVVRPRAFAQAVGQSQKNSPAGSTARSATNPASASQDVLQELERMRAQIQEVETQLKQSGTEATTRTESSSESGTTQNVTSPAAAAPVLPLAGHSSEPGPAVNPAKTEPFAFADWIWLNGNPRTKQRVSLANSSRRGSVLVVDHV